jgi:hypothetical protein
MEAKYRNKRFCSAKCRVYFNRENKKSIPILNKLNEPKENKLSFLEKLRNKRLGLK